MTIKADGSVEAPPHGGALLWAAFLAELSKDVTLVSKAEQYCRAIDEPVSMDRYAFARTRPAVEANDCGPFASLSEMVGWFNGLDEPDPARNHGKFDRGASF